MIPVIAIVGRPNVGKSTLFNCLTQTRDAMVANQPGVTRDRLYGLGNLYHKNYVVIDTGGIGVGEENIEGLTLQQADQAILEATKILFVVDARKGLVPGDIEIANKLRKLNKSVILVINKTEGADINIISSEFHQLGLGKPVCISASHQQNITELIKDLPESEEIVEENQGIKVAIIGKPNVGKSTLVNRLLGEERVIVYDMPGTTRDSVYINLERQNKKYILIDTAGVRRKSHIKEHIEKISVVKSLQAIEDANVVLFLIDARSNITEQDLGLLGFILDSGKALVIAVNKWDGLSPYDREQVRKGLDRRLSFIDFAKIKFISALHGTGVGDLWKDIQKAYDSAMKKISTPMINKLLQSAVQQHQPPRSGMHRIKLRYAHAGGSNPPLIIIHGNQVKKLPGSYIRYLQGYFRKALRLIGTPIRIEFKEGENPFRNK